jgi:thiol-disulfide isomerase/thioredoxin
MAMLCVSAVGSFAQEAESELNPIKWSIKAAPSEPNKTGEKFVIELTAQIDKGWHLYSTERVEGGPTPTRIVIPTGQSFELAGEIDSPAPHSSYDPNFQVATEYYDNSVTFAIPVRPLASSSGRNKVMVQVRYQACTQTLCLPPKVLELETLIQIASAAAASTPTKSANENASASLTVGAKVPDFDFTDFSGKSHRFSEYRGRYVLLDFWATWCSPCLADIPHLKESYLKYHAQGFEIIGMDSETLGQGQVEPEFIKETQARAREIVSTRGVTWTQATTDTSVPVAVKVFGVDNLPVKILVDPDGRVAARIKTSSELDQLLATLLVAKE